MKASKYNIFFDHKGQMFAFNSMTAALNKIDDDFVEIINSIDKISDNQKDEKSELIEKMKKAGYITEDFIDEMEFIQFYSMKKKFKSNTLSLVIAPTLFCNFACPYCFESSKTETMDDNVKDQILKFVESKLKDKKYLKIVWFGGEPLCAKNSVYDLSDRFIKLCEKMNVKYSARMISNFYLVDKSTIEKLREYKVEQVQVTIDGTKKSHDSRRVLKNGNGTFDKIIDNILLSKKMGLKVVIRVNVDLTNVNDAKELVNYLISRDLQGIDVYLGHTMIFDENDASKFGKACLSLENFSKINIDFAKLLIKKGWHSEKIIKSLYPETIPFHCSAQTENAFIVGPKGELYKCEREIGNCDKIIGFVDSKNMSDDVVRSPQTMKNINWLVNSIFMDKKCQKCNILPLCMGGCLDTKNKLKEPFCVQWKYNLIDTLKLRCDYFYSSEKK